MKRQFLKYYLFAVGLFFYFASAGQEYVIQRLTVNDGLPSDRVNCVYEDSFGYLWVGTSNGLGRFDGKKFTNYGYSEGLPYLQINAIFEDSRHRLWVGSTKGIVQLQGNDFTTYKTNNNESYTWTYGFYETAKNEVWALTNKGIFRFNDTVWTRVSIYPAYENKACKEILNTSSGLLFNYGNILVKENNEGVSSIVSQSPDESDYQYFSSMQEHSGKIYVSVYDKLYRIESDTLKLVIDDIPVNQNFNYYVDNEERCFLTIEGKGLFVYQISGTDSVVRQPSFNTFYKSNRLFNIYCDKHKNLWMLSYEGLLKIQPKTFTDYQREIFKEPVKEIRNIVSLYNDLLISSSASGFHVLHDYTLNKVPVPTFYSDSSQYRHDNVDGYTDDNADGTWMLMRSGKLLFTRQGKLFNYTDIITRKTKEPFYDIAVHPFTNKLFVCVDSVLLTGDNNKLEVYHDADGKTFDKPISVLFTKEGVGVVNVFFKGIYFITKENKIIKAPPELDIIDERVSGWIYQGIRGYVWIRNSGRGLVCFRISDTYQAKNIQQFTTAEGLPSNDILDIATDKMQRLWVCSNTGLAVMSYNEKQDTWDIYNVSKQLGLNFESWVDGRMGVDTLGNIWLSTIDNLVKIYPSKIFLQKEIPRAVIEKVLLDMKETEWKKYSDSTYSYFQLPYNPVFNYQENSLGIQFNGTNLSDVSVQEYSYMLMPLDTTWSHSSPNNFVSLLKLTPGNYVFKVKARGRGTAWSEPASFAFTIERPYWEKWWFRLCLITFAAAIIVFIYSRRIKAVRHQAQVQNLLNELEMKALKAQMNPHFIYNALNSIQSLIADEKKSEAINYVGKFSRLLRQVLEYTDSNVVTLEKELQTLNLYIQLESLRLNMDLHYDLVMDDDLMTENEKVPPLILQPFVENALWHGLSRKQGEKKLRVSVSQEGDYLAFNI
ncbi:MAG: histidine kinase [Bacteroidota bacterium]